MNDAPSLRLTLGSTGVSVWSPDLFADFELSRVREFLSRAFAVEEVEAVDLERARATGRIRYRRAPNPASIWRKLSRALSSPEAAPASDPALPRPRRIDAESLYLERTSATPIRVTRIDNVLSTWRVRDRGKNTLSLWHPLLRARRDVMFRLEEELAGMLGVEDFRTNALTAGVFIRFDRRVLTAERLAARLEKAWPRLLDGLDGSPSQKRLVASAGLVALAYTGQYVVPAVRPIAVAGVTLYSFPNVVNAARQLRRGEVGLPVMYSTGLAFMLVSGLPFTASVMAGFMQLWPYLSRRKMVDAQRRLFAGQRRRPQWARVSRTDGVEDEVSVDALAKGQLVVVRRGEIVPVDGVVVSGFAAVAEEAPLSGRRVHDKSAGDTVRAGAWVRDGDLTLRVERAGAQTFASYVDSLLPHASKVTLPSSFEAERIANRNVKPALALAAASLLLTRTPQPAQALIRPDYATGPRLSAQFSALRGIAEGWERGLLFRNPAALDRLATATDYVLDDTAQLERRSLEVTSVHPLEGVSPELVLGYALAGCAGASLEQSLALTEHAETRTFVPIVADSLERLAGVTRYRDRRGNVVEIANDPYFERNRMELPAPLLRLVQESSDRSAGRGDIKGRDLSATPLWVMRNGKAIGAIVFARIGEPVGRRCVAALEAKNPKARLIYVSRRPQSEARAVARSVGIEVYHYGLSDAAKVTLIRSLGGTTLWIGDGSDHRAREALAASSVSISVAPLSPGQEDRSDILLPYAGLSGVPEAIGISRAHAKRLARDYRVVYAANLFGVAGAVLTGFSPLQVGLISNVGTGLIYARHARALERAAASAERERSRQRQAPAR